MKRYIHTADAVFALVLFCAFALSMLLVLMTGATSYQDIRDAVENHNSENMCVSYIATKVRHSDVADGVSIGEIGGTPAIVLSLEAGGLYYDTYVYLHDGYVRELPFIERGDEFSPKDGLNVMAVKDLEFELTEDGLLHVLCTGTGGRSAETFLSLRSGVTG